MSGEVVTRIDRAYRNEVAERGGDEVARRLVGKWLAGVEYREWFALVAERDALLEAVEEDDPAKWSFQTLLFLAETILARHYPESVFPQHDGDDGDPGPRFIRRLRDALAAVRSAGVSA